MPNADEIGEQIADDVSSAIDAAQETAEQAAETAEQLAAAAMEGHRGEQIRNLEDELDECQRTQADLADAIAALTLGQTETAAKLDLLIQQQSRPTQDPAPEPEPENREDHTNQEPEAPTQEAPPEQAAPPEPPRKKRFRDRLI